MPEACFVAMGPQKGHACKVLLAEVLHMLPEISYCSESGELHAAIAIRKRTGMIKRVRKAGSQNIEQVQRAVKFMPAKPHCSISPHGDLCFLIQLI